ncbi:MAG TPA: sigma-54 dependent transcriptional regulator [Nitrospiraceae bacterium]|jgi:DNA-binding NtrC family response regulator
MLSPSVLLISTNAIHRPLLERAVPSVEILTATSSDEALRIMRQRPDLTAIVCEDKAGTDTRSGILALARREMPTVPVIVLGENGSAKAAVETLHQGAADYLVQPVASEDLRTALEQTQARPAFRRHPQQAEGFDHILGVSPQMKLIRHLAGEVARTDATVLITGESGTGKELFARAIHAFSPRAQGPLVALNCAGIPENLLESELFGYQRGAFTDAKQTKPGKFQLAEGGTLFLDEIGEMSPTAQAKLLRVLEDHHVDPLGGTQSHKVNIRVLAATNEDLPSHIKAGRFRLDLFYRLNVYQLRIPPLRERPEDIEPILIAFLDTARVERGSRIRTISPEAVGILQQHPWPGNVRELHNVVEWLTITCKDEVIQAGDLPASVREGRSLQDRFQAEKPSLLAFGLSFQEMEKKMLEEALRKSSGNVSEASRLLKMTRNTLRYRMAKYQIQ